MSRLTLGMVLLVTSLTLAQFPVDQAPPPASGAWKVAAPDVPAVNVTAKSLSMPLPAGFNVVFGSPQSGRWLVVAELTGKNAKLYDLATGQMTKFHPKMDFDKDKCVLSADGKTMALWRDESAKGVRKRVIDIGVPTTGQRLTSIETPIEGLVQLQWLAFGSLPAASTTQPAGATRPAAPLNLSAALLVMSEKSNVATLNAYDARSGKPLWTRDLGTARSRTRLMHPSGRYFLLSSDAAKSLDIHDTATGEVAGQISLPPGDELSALAFSPDGRQLVAVVGGPRVLAWDLATGRVARDVALLDKNVRVGRASSDRGRLLELLGPDRAIVSGQYLIDLTSGRTIGKLEDSVPAFNGAPFRVVDARTVLRMKEGSAFLETLDEARLAAAAETGADPASAAEDITLPPLKPADTASAKLLDDLATDWKVQPDPAPARSLPKRLTALPKDANVNALAIARNLNGAAIAHQTGFRAGGGADVVLLDLAGNKPAKSLAVPMGKETRFAALSADGTRGALVSENTRIDVYDLDPLKHVAGWRLGDKNAAQIKDVVFVDNDRLVIAEQQSLGLWTIATAKQEWRRPGRVGAVQPSPGGKYLLADLASLVMIDPASGQLLGQFAESDGASLGSFSGDGKRLAGSVGDYERRTAVVWDVATGQIASQQPIPLRSPGAIACIDGNVLLVGEYLMAVDKGSVFWKFETGATTRLGFANNKLWFAQSTGANSPRAINCAEIPDGARQAAAKAKPPALVIGPGTKVAIAASLEAPEREKLVARLKQDGLVIDDAAPIKLVSSMTTENLGTETYRTIGGRGGEQTLTKSRTTRRIAWQDAAGKALWEEVGVAQTGGGGMMVTLRDGETVQDRYGKHEADFRNQPFATDRVPSKVYALPETTLQGTTTLGPATGVRR